MIPRKPRELSELSHRNLRLYAAPNSIFKEPEVIVGVTVRKNRVGGLARCFESILAQRGGPGQFGVVVLIDTNIENDLSELRLPERMAGFTWIVLANCGSAARARNAILDFVDEEVPSARWVARLDSDDRFSSESALVDIVRAGDEVGAAWVLAGNRVYSKQLEFLRMNPAEKLLTDRNYLIHLLARMADGTAENELPSCNLLLSTNFKKRYPEYRSAEDHWLLAELLFFEKDSGRVADGVVYADYTLGGEATAEVKEDGSYRRMRTAIHEAVKTWDEVTRLPGKILGWGNEGIVRYSDGRVIKHFYRDAITKNKLEWLQSILSRRMTSVPAIDIERADDEFCIISYPYEETEAADRISKEQVKEFLLECLESRIVCANIKRNNFRVNARGKLVYIDIGKWIISMDVSCFRDGAARLYSIGVLGHSDHDLLRRPTDLRCQEIWDSLPGFSEFYRQVISAHAHKEWRRSGVRRVRERPRRSDVTLLVKACAMDADFLWSQSVHIVDQLTGPGDFAERILLVDPYSGPFIRQHCSGNLPRVLEVAESLQKSGVFDRVLVAPLSESVITEINTRWFEQNSTSCRSLSGVPLAPQLWGFEQVTTRYVLQSDIDVLIGRRNPNHDVVNDMITACLPDDILGVGFNIARPVSDGFRDYFAEPGQFVPEVRLGLLDLQRIFALRPLPNRCVNGRLEKTWYRSLQMMQEQTGLRTLRGGDSSTFYVHPLNDRKQNRDHLHIIRDLVAQGRVPESQLGQWDPASPDPEWAYALRHEPIVVYAAGRNIDEAKIERFCNGLAIQENSDFGVIVVDDASSGVNPRALSDQLAFLEERLTLVRTAMPEGRMKNLTWAVRTLCSNPETLVVIVDLDDALMDRRVMGDLKNALHGGHDLVIAAPFRPDAPIRIYSPDFIRARETYGGDTWIHLRAFKKCLFDRLPDSLLKENGEWLKMCTDYATMVPMSEIAKSPIFISNYSVWHERSTIYDEEMCARRDELIMRLLTRTERADGFVDTLL